MRKLLVVSIILLAIVRAIAQPQSVLTKKFDSYQATWPLTKLHLIFNQNKFSLGDTAWFKAYFLKEDFSPVTGRQLIDFNLVNSKGESKLHFKFEVNQGVGQNQMIIPPALPAGAYFVTAHSSWMENFGPTSIFKEKILIVEKNGWVPAEQPLIIATVEGGHLISDLSNKVVFQTNRTRAGIQIIDDAGHEVARAVTNKHGVGTRDFTPKKNAIYYARFLNDSTRIKLPPTENDGCSLSITITGKEDSIKIIARSTASSLFRNERLTLLAGARSKIYYASELQLENKNVTTLLVPAINFPGGIVHVSLLTQSGNLLASRDFYNPERDAVSAKITIATHDLHARAKVSAAVSLTDSKGQPVQGEFSIHVLNAGLFENEKQNSLFDEFTIPSGISGKYIPDQSDSTWLADLNDYMVSATATVPWKDILANNPAKPRFAFSNFIQKRGTVSFFDSDKPVPEGMDIIFFLQRSGIRYQTTVENGKVWLAIPDLAGEDELFFAAETFFYVNGVKHGREVPNVKIEWDSASFKLPPAPLYKEEGLDSYAAFAMKKRLMDRSFGYYFSPNEVENPHEKISGSYSLENEIKGADITVKVQDYVLFPSVTELIREVVPSLQLRKTKQKSTILVNLSESMWELRSGNPVYIIDGIATKNTDFFLSLKPADLITIKIVTDARKLERFGLMGKNGIVIVQTKKGDVREPLDPSKKIEGLSRPLGFKVRNHLGENDRHRPDFRSTIYWNPAIKTDEHGKAIIEFSCSDDIGKLSIRIDGFAKWLPFSAVGDVEVVLSQAH